MNSDFFITHFPNLHRDFSPGHTCWEARMPEQENSNLLRGKLYVVLCPLDSIRGKDNQFLSVEELKETPVYNLVNLTGFNLPLILSQDYEILDGMKRWQIAKLKEIEKVPCVLVPNFEDKKLEDSFLHLVTSFRYSLRPGEWYDLLLNEYGIEKLKKEISVEDLSKRFGMSRIQSEVLSQYIQTME